MFIREWTLFVALLIVCSLLIAPIKCSGENDEQTQDCTDIARDDVPLLVFSTLGGGLTAVDPITSEIKWRIEDEPAIKVPTPSDSNVSPYLPDPRDGSLYQLGDMGSLKKLPYTIPQLVASAPCRSSDGILYSGKKKDTWFLIDPKTGKREKVVGFGADSKESIGWATSRSVYLGRTQYTVLMYDSRTKDKNTKPWNVTFFDYSAHTMAPEVSQEYAIIGILHTDCDCDLIGIFPEFLHFSGSSSGLTVTLDRETGTFMWQKDLTSPVVAVFLLGPDGLLSVPFTTVSDGVLKSIIESARDGQRDKINLFQSLYVGEHDHGTYALPTLVDENTKTISSEPAVKLLDGPHANANPNLVYLNTLMETNNDKNKNVIVLGHYQMPKVKDDMQLSISPPKKSLNTGQSTDEPETGGENHKELLVANNDLGQSFELNLNREGNKNKIIPPPKQSRLADRFKFISFGDRSPKEYISNAYRQSQSWLNDQESKILKVLLIILFGLVIAMFWYMKHTVGALQKQSQSSSQTTQFGSKGNGIYEDLIDLGNGEIQVGKIRFDPNEVLGKGCEGTFVFKGSFEKRAVAVKRLLPECFTLADREVSLLRESDAHENVVRYFCTEQDRQFKYIAVELCSATLQDYTEGKISAELKQGISMIQVLEQATHGLMHLHSLNIVHRDIKPQNVLLSLPSAHRAVRAMISDFGLCKKLNFGRTSFSRRSGITGTEGWIAPEMLKGQRTTTAVDIFSLGCVYYYVMSNGQHPFGDVVKRQLNILSYEHDLRMFSNPDILDSTGVLAEELIKDMINEDHTQRPPAKAILTHPLFWSSEKILNFLQDVSDRVEKLDHSYDPLRSLEKNSKFITRVDWNIHLDESVTSDLRKYRAYQGSSVRDLLRALRNKKHHYHELNTESQIKLGALPHAFTRYWIDRFPRLISHSYHAFESVSNEHAFVGYYPVGGYKFSKPDYFYEITEDFKPFDGSMSRDSPKRYKENRYRPKDYPNFVMDRKPGSNANMDLTYNNNGRTSKNKGAYNFHRISTSLSVNLKNIMNEITRSGDNVPQASDEPTGSNSDNQDTQSDQSNQEIRLETKEEPIVWKLESDENISPGNNNVLQKTPFKYKGKSKKAKKDSTTEDINLVNRKKDVDEDGFVKVRHRGGTKKQRESQNDNVHWVVPRRESN